MEKSLEVALRRVKELQKQLAKVESALTEFIPSASSFSVSGDLPPRVLDAVETLLAASRDCQSLVPELGDVRNEIERAKAVSQARPAPPTSGASVIEGTKVTAEQEPIVVKELFNLQSKGISEASISFRSTTIESDKAICVLDQSVERKTVVVVSLTDPSPSGVMRRPITADSGIMHPSKNVLALASQMQLQVFNLDLKARVAELTVNDPLVWWHWIDDETIALVTAEAVFHWNAFEPGSQPLKAFDRIQSPGGPCQVISYSTSRDKHWMALVSVGSRDGRVFGHTQIYNTDRAVSQIIDGSAATYATHTVVSESGRVAEKPSTLFVFASRTPATSKLHILEVQQGDPSVPFKKTSVDMFYPPEFDMDFPVSVQVSEKHSVVFVMTKSGFIHVFEISTGVPLYHNRITTDTVFATAPTAGGFIGVSKKGQVFSVTINEKTVTSFVRDLLGDPQLALRLASEAKLPVADELFVTDFEALLREGKIKEAATLAMRAPGTLLRNAETIARLEQLPTISGQLSPLLVYFGTVLDAGKLNAVESVALSRKVIPQNRTQLLEKWLQEDKLELSEELGDVICSSDKRLGLVIFAKLMLHEKVIRTLAELDQYDKIISYCDRFGIPCGFIQLFEKLFQQSPDSARKFAVDMFSRGKPVDLQGAIEILLSKGCLKEATSIALDCLKDNQPEYGPLQTRILEENIRMVPVVADAIISNGIFTRYDVHRIAQLAEQAGLYQSALELFAELQDSRRIISEHAAEMSPEFVVDFFGRFSADDALELLRPLLKEPSLKAIALQVAVRYRDTLTIVRLLALFEEFSAFDLTFFFLKQLIDTSEDPEVHHKFLDAALRIGQSEEAERISLQSKFLDTERVRGILSNVEPELAERVMTNLTLERAPQPPAATPNEDGADR